MKESRLISENRQENLEKLEKNIIIIGKFNLLNYDIFSEYSRKGKLYFFHASTTWFINDKRIRKCLLRPGDFIEQEMLGNIEANSMEFLRELEKSSKSIGYEGIYLMPLLRYWNFRRHSMLLESYIVLSECIKRYKPEMVVIDASCNYNSRGKIYKAVAGCLLEKEKITFDFTGSKSVEEGFNRLQYFQYFIKEQVRAIISLVINSFCRPNSRKKTIIFSGSFSQMSQVMTWLTDASIYNIVFFKQGIPLNKVLFLLKHKIMWRRIPIIMSKRKDYKNEIPDSFINGWFKSGDVINRFFRGEDILSGLMMQFIKEDISQNWDTIANLIRTSGKIFRCKDVSAVFLDEDQTLQNRIIVDTANYYDKETFVFCHGILAQRTNFIFSTKNIFTYGKKVSQQIKDYPNDHQPNIYEIGTPRLDRLKRLKASDSRRKIQREFCIPPDKKIIFVPMGDLSLDKEHYTNRLKDEVQMACFKAVKRLSSLVQREKNLFLVIKLKNGEKEKELIYDTYGIGDSDRIGVTGTYDIDYLISGCDMIINIITTVLYYGLVAQKPVIRIKYKVDNSLWEFINTDADEALEIDSFLFEEKIMEMLYNEQKKMQFHQKASRYLFENHCYEDLRVGERLLHITHDILN